MDWLHTEDKVHVTLCTPKNIADEVRGSDHSSPEHPFRALDFLVLDEVCFLVNYVFKARHVIVSFNLLYIRLICFLKDHTYGMLKSFLSSYVSLEEV